MKKPLVSVILPVYNGDKYLEAAIRSILDQTYAHFELIIINDGSRDRSEEVVKQFNDARIRYIYQENQGLGKTLVHGVSLAQGELIARQDADDISLPLRFERQVEFFQNHPNVVLLGTWADIIDEDDKYTGRTHEHPTDSQVLKFELVFNNPFVHSSVMFRIDEAAKVGGYADERKAFEDYDLWSRISHHYPVANLGEKLLLYREVSSGISKSNPNYDLWVIEVSRKNIHFYLPELSESSCHELASVFHGNGSEKFRVSDREIEQFVQRVMQVIPVSEQEDIRRVNIDQKVFAMKRRYYNSRLTADNSSVLEKLVFRIKRKLLFMFKPKSVIA